MEKEFIPYTLSLELKELGFDEPCMYIFDKQRNNLMCPIYGLFENEEPNRFLNAPLYQQAFRFIREKYGYDVSIKKCTPSEYKFEIEQLFVEGNNHYFIDFHFPSHEVAELECLKKLIETVKRKKL